MTATNLLTPEDLDSIRGKLERAEENIRNLSAELSAFLKAGPDPDGASDGRKAAEEWVRFHSRRGIPPRFAILAGEIVHHLRSCLDHLAWALSSESYRRSDGTRIAFPIFIDQPKKKGKLSSYDQNIEGVRSLAARKLIEDLQPYQVAEPKDHPLAVVHELDRIDKHRNLVLVVSTFDARIEVPLASLTTRVIGLPGYDYPRYSEPAQKVQVQLSRQVAFATVGAKKNQTVVPALERLTSSVRDVVRRFSEL